mgnify:CR=1 FL=1
MSPATCCRSRSMPRRRSFTTTRTCSAPRASIRRSRRRPGPRSALAAKRLRAAARQCGLTTSWPSWINVENFSAFHNLPLATKANGFGGLDAELTFNNPLMVRHIAQLAEWQTTKVFDYSGRGQSAEPRFQKGECAIFIGSSGDARRHQGQFEIRGRLRHDAVLARRRPARRRIHIIGGATLWVLRDRLARRVWRRRQILRLSVEAGSPGRLAPERPAICRSPAPPSS